jgi:Ca2+/Na+ antiporter
MWSNFFIAAAGASAALAGLVIVAVSVNIASILKYPHLPARAAAAIGSLILILVASMAALVPQPARYLGVEILVFAAGCWLLEFQSMRKSVAASREHHRPQSESLWEIATVQVQLLPFLIGAILLMAGRPAGMYWVAAGTIAIFIFSTLNAWVLLVEILR